jgi:hypothetical protein
MTNPTGGAVLRLECECGFVVEATEAEAVEVARHHSRLAHGIELSVDYVRSLARPRPDR